MLNHAQHRFVESSLDVLRRTITLHSPPNQPYDTHCGSSLRATCLSCRAKDVLVNGHRVTVRYNDTCHFYQPPRAHHCSVNDNCIERFDHHCPWVGTTIGKVGSCCPCVGFAAAIAAAYGVDVPLQS